MTMFRLLFVFFLALLPEPTRAQVVWSSRNAKSSIKALRFDHFYPPVVENESEPSAKSTIFLYYFSPAFRPLFGPCARHPRAQVVLSSHKAKSSIKALRFDHFDPLVCENESDPSAFVTLLLYYYSPAFCPLFGLSSRHPREQVVLSSHKAKSSIKALRFDHFDHLVAKRGPQEAKRGPQQATGGHSRPQVATAGHRRPQEAAGGHMRLQEATGSHERP